MPWPATSTAIAVLPLSPIWRTCRFADPHDVLLPRVWQLRNNLTAYDAVYVALAEALDAPLLTRDKRLANAARRHARVELV
jgi:predicted nucleic acid-binding protein